MFHFLGFLFIIIIAILLIGLSIIGTQQSGSSSNEEPKTRIKEETAHGRHKKLFSQDEGEYVDFEEIKEE